MFSSLLCQSSPYADIAFVAIVVLGLVLGIIRGFAKSFKGIFLTLAIMLISLLLIAPTFASVRTLDVFSNLENTLTEKFEGDSAIFSTPIYIESTGGELSYYVKVTNDSGEVENVPLESSMGSDTVSSIKGQFALWLAKTFITKDGQSVGSVAGVFVTDIITAVVMFVVYCIILGLICWLLRKIFAKMHQSDNGALKAIDRIFGALISTAFALIFVLTVLAILNALRGKIPTVDQYIDDSTICKYFYNNNPIATLFAQIFGK